jgi:hypothetical protein
VAALALLAWPLGRVGVSFVHEDGGVRRVVGVWGGAARVVVDSSLAKRPLAREQFRLEVGPRPEAQTQVLTSPTGVAPAGPRVFGIGLAWVVAGSVGLLVLVVGLPALGRRRMRRRGLCVACGYKRPGDGPCPECGLTERDAEERMRTRPGRLVRDAGAALFAVLLALSCGVWAIAAADRRAEERHRAQTFDYSWYLRVCEPRIDGVVSYAEPGSGPNSLVNVARGAGPGATIVLLPGKHDLGDEGRGRSPALNGLKDVWLVGSGAETTELTMSLEAAERVRIEGVTIECRDEPAIDLRRGGCLHLKDCRVRGYNSGAGGSEAVFGVGAVLIAEGCEFDGKPGRASNSMRGCAFDLRQENRVFLRGVRFIDNQEILRDVPHVMDRCTVTTDQPQYFLAPGGSPSWIRETPMNTARGWAGTPAAFKEALDDLEPLKGLAAGKGKTAWEDEVARAAASKLELGDEMWTGLLMHPSPEVRRLAAGQLKIGPDPAAYTLSEALGLLDQKLPAKVSLSILSAGEQARAGLEAALAGGNERVKANAAALLRLLDTQPPVPEIVRAHELWKE